MGPTALHTFRTFITYFCKLFYILYFYIFILCYKTNVTIIITIHNDLVNLFSLKPLNIAFIYTYVVKVHKLRPQLVFKLSCKHCLLLK